MALRIGKQKDNTGDDWSDSALADNTAPGGDPADSFGSGGNASSRKSPPPALLAGIVVLLLAAIGAGLYFFVFSSPSEDETAPIAPTTQVATSPETPESPDPAAPPAEPAATAQPAPKPAAATPNPQPPKPKPTPTPTPGIPTGLTGQDGKGLEPGNTVLAVQPISPELQAELRQLWQQGANAKWRGDYAGARRAWTRMLQLRPGHPGVQSAIDKLPR